MVYEKYCFVIKDLEENVIKSMEITSEQTTVEVKN